jgi:hypothetical protein
MPMLYLLGPAATPRPGLDLHRPQSSTRRTGGLANSRTSVANQRRLISRSQFPVVEPSRSPASCRIKRPILIASARAWRTVSSASRVIDRFLSIQGLTAALLARERRVPSGARRATQHRAFARCQSGYRATPKPEPRREASKTFPSGVPSWSPTCGGRGTLNGPPPFGLQESVPVTARLGAARLVADAPAR